MSIDGTVAMKASTIEKVLSEGTIKSVVPFFDHEKRKVYGLYKVKILHRKNHLTALWRPRKLEKKYSNSIKQGTKYLREIAYYQVAKFSQIYNVPPVVKRKISNYVGSLQLLINSDLYSGDGKYLAICNYDQQELNKIAVLDYICGNIDRNINNLVFHKKKLFVVDNGLSFVKDNNIRLLSPKSQVIRQFFVNSEETKKHFIKRLSNKKKVVIAEKLKSYINQREISSFFKRLDKYIYQNQK